MTRQPEDGPRGRRPSGERTTAAGLSREAASLQLQRAVEEIARKRDALERDANRRSRRDEIGDEDDRRQDRERSRRQDRDPVEPSRDERHQAAPPPTRSRAGADLQPPRAPARPSSRADAGYDMEADDRSGYDRHDFDRPASRPARSQEPGIADRRAETDAPRRGDVRPESAIAALRAEIGDLRRSEIRPEPSAPVRRAEIGDLRRNEPQPDPAIAALRAEIGDLRRSERSDPAISALRAEIGDLRRSMEERTLEERREQASEMRRLTERVETMGRSRQDDGALATLREELASLRDAVRDSVPTAQLRTLEGAYDDVVARLDELRGLVDNPRTISDLVQRLAEIRRLLAQTPTESDLVGLSDRIDQLSARLDSSRELNRTDLSDIERQISGLARAVADQDPGALMKTIERRLAEVSLQVVTVEQRLGGLDDLIRWQDEAERQSAVLSQVAQRTEQLPRVAHQMERQSAALDGLGRSVGVLPELTAELAEIRRGLPPEMLPGLSADLAAIRRAIPSDMLPALAAELNEIRRALPADLPDLAAGLDELRRALPPEALPGLNAEVSELRRTIEAESSRSSRDIEALLERMDAFTLRLESSVPGRVDEAVDRRLAEFTQQLDRIDGPIDAQTILAVEQRFTTLADLMERRLGAMAAAPLPAALPDDLMSALARIEAHLANETPVDRFTELENRIEDLAGSLKGIGRIAAPDLSAIEENLAALRLDVAGLGAPAVDRLEKEICTLADRIESLSERAGDEHMLSQLEFRLADLASRLDTLPNGNADVVDAIVRMERTIGNALAEQKLARNDQAASAADDGEWRRSVTDIRQELSDLQASIRESGHRDRHLLIAIGEAVERLASRDEEMDAADDIARERASLPRQERAARRPDRSDARPLETLPPHDVDAETWTEIERVLTNTIAQTPPNPEPRVIAPDSADDGEDLVPRVFGRRDEAGTQRRPKRPLTTLSDEDDRDQDRNDGDGTAELPDPDLPLEPGSGKPAPRVAADRGRKGGTAQPGDKSAAPRGDSVSGPPRGEPSKADFIAAARRAAMAADPTAAAGKAKAEVEAGEEASAPARGRVFSLFRNRRKQILMATAAVAVLALGWQYVRPMFDPAEVPSIASAPVPEAEVPAEDFEIAAVDPAGPAAVDEPGPSATMPIAGTPTPADGTVVDQQAMAPTAVDPGSFGAAPEMPPIGRFAPEAAGRSPTAPAAAGQAGSPSAVSPSVGTPTAGSPSATQPSAGAPPVGAPVAAPVASAPPAAAPAASEPPSPLAATIPMPPDAVGPLALRQAAANGDPLALFEVAARYSEARGVPQDLEQAVRWYTLAAEAGQPVAQYRLGSLYEKGHGTPRDPATALSWYDRAAKAGNVTAMHNIAVMLASGSTGRSEFEQAARWFESAAEHGVSDSQFNLAVLYANGSGVPRDLAASYKWFALAAAAGDADAAKMRDNVAQELGKDDLARARLAVETWTAKDPLPAANEVEITDPAWTAVPEQTSAALPVGDSLADVQRMLAQRGYDPGPADGRMGSRTREAISAFQLSVGLPVTGEVDDALIRSLANREI